jgi:2-keto-4-pentenoate hydratase
VRDDQVETLAAQLLAARRDRRIMDVAQVWAGPAGRYGLADAYRVQAAVTRARLAAGERVVGWKLGYTSAAMRRQMGVDAPNHGPLTDAMLLASGARVPAAALQPRAEPEVALRFAADVPSAAGVEEVLAAAEGAYACLEVVDSVWSGYRFRLEDNTADGSSAAWVVLGGRLPAMPLDMVEVELFRNGGRCGRATGAAASGHPAAGVAWLAGALADRGQRVGAGQVVITGGLTAAVPLEQGDEVTARFSGGVTVSVRRDRRAGRWLLDR